MPLRRLSLAAAAVLLSLPSLAVSASDPALIDDFTPYPYLWKVSRGVTLDNPEILAGDPLALPGQGASERVLSVAGPIHASAEITFRNCEIYGGVVVATLWSTREIDARDVDPLSISLGGSPAFGFRLVQRTSATTQLAAAAVAETDLMLLFLGAPACSAAGAAEPALTGGTYDGRRFATGATGMPPALVRPYAASTDWSLAEGLRFWYYGQNTGDQLKLELRDNRVEDPGPSGWRLVWHDEFDGAAGQSFSSANWTPEIGDGTAQGIPGWGNNELEYYTGDPANASLDGASQLQISVQQAPPGLTCHYGPCLYTSARLISQNKVEIGHGRIETRLKVPAGAGLWPAFWALGSNIGQVGWPSSGEIDIMEHIGRKPTEVFGTLHGPGYSGGSGIGSTYDMGSPVADAYHVFALEWTPERLDWYVDGILFNTVTRADVGTNQWVFDKPFYMILNVAIGGYLGGEVDPQLTFPRTLLVDYIRVYAAPDTAERFEAAFSDDFTGWQEIALPFADFVRSASQLPDAPEDGLTLSEVWGYGFRLPSRGLTAQPLYLDKVKLIQPTSWIVTNTNDSGPGSLRTGINAIAPGGTISFDPALAGSTITLASGTLVVASKTVTIDATDAPGVTVQGNGSDRLMIIDGDAGAVIRGLTFKGGFAWDLAGGFLSNGDLELDHVVVRENVAQCGSPDWWKGGGGIYVGGGGSLVLKDSTITNNTSRMQNGSGADCNGGGIYVFQNATLTVERSTISGNTAANVGGGIRMLGSGTIVNSTISGNSNVGWEGPAIFHTDGVLSVVNSTIVNNSAPADGDTKGAIFVGTFTAANATLTLANNVITQNGTHIACFVAYWGAGTVTLTSVGNNVYADATCYPVASDQVVGIPVVEALADNGGPTQTHALVSQSPALDWADLALCPATDQRGIARPQGAGCDAGSFEAEPVLGPVSDSLPPKAPKAPKADSPQGKRAPRSQRLPLPFSY